MDSAKINDMKQMYQLIELAKISVNKSSVQNSLMDGMFKKIVFFVFPDRLDKTAEALFNAVKLNFNKIA